MSDQLLIILFSSAVGLVNAILLGKIQSRRPKREDSRQEQIATMQKDIDLLKSGYITADRLRLLIKEELRKRSQLSNCAW